MGLYTIGGDNGVLYRRFGIVLIGGALARGLLLSWNPIYGGLKFRSLSCPEAVELATVGVGAGGRRRTVWWLCCL